jgi:DNA (cytosine-5)-methyltransferase 1
MSRLTIGSLFSGIGGLELGLEWAGLGPTLWQVEQDAYCRAVLAKHWPDATRHEDVRHVGRANLVPVDVICGGFPCQDISSAGNKVGIGGPRSGLWFEYSRILRELRPRYVVVENVADLLHRGIGDVLGRLADLGYDAEWSVLSACAVGAPHPRERLFVLAYANAERRDRRAERDITTVQGGGREGNRLDAHGLRHRVPRPRHRVHPAVTAAAVEAWHAGEPHARRVVDGVPSRLDVARLAALGNAVVPQVAEVVGRMILAREQSLTESAA